MIKLPDGIRPDYSNVNLPDGQLFFWFKYKNRKKNNHINNKTLIVICLQLIYRWLLLFFFHHHYTVDRYDTIYIINLNYDTDIVYAWRIHDIVLLGTIINNIFYTLGRLWKHIFGSLMTRSWYLIVCVCRLI